MLSLPCQVCIVYCLHLRVALAVHRSKLCVKKSPLPGQQWGEGGEQQLQKVATW